MKKKKTNCIKVSLPSHSSHVVVVVVVVEVVVVVVVVVVVTAERVSHPTLLFALLIRKDKESNA